ncbi:Cellobiose dehydrogenase 4 [Colletotrichum chlorophyti]|uniref:Cellobiose dehydrogenase 4 n=1 Tax=Colletotrichum chlorophyti TaxID=708187 RepID=A0A1Q8RLR1_9PEZI|nr:Cellobiose dehydrogenase 4 [Colletotrichum chlorophyti]
MLFSNLILKRRFRCNIYALLVFIITVITLVTADDDEPTSSPAQQSVPFTDQATSLAMERFFGARTQFAFAMTLPEEPSSSFIGQLSFPLVNGAGWGAMGLTGDMKGNFIFAVWPDGDGGVMATFRQATNEDNPPEVKGDFAVRPIAKGVSVNATSLMYTFLCENCLNATLGLGPEATGGNAVMGWALSERAVRNPRDPGASLGFHERGFGPFTARLVSARSARFGAVAATAGEPVASSNRAIAVTPNAFRDGGSDGDNDDDEESGGKDGRGKGREQEHDDD